MFINEIVLSNNSLKNEIEELVSLCKELEDDNTFIFYDGLDDEIITDWEKKNGVKIPETYKDWLRFSNGAIINGNTATFYDIDKIIINASIKPEEFVVIGTLIGDGQFLCFSKITGEFVWFDHGDEERYSDFRQILNIIMDIL